MSNKKQSSVEWLKEVYTNQGRILNSQFEQAKEMHKEEIEQSYMSGAYDKATIFEEAQTYYTNTFGGDK